MGPISRGLKIHRRLLKIRNVCVIKLINNKKKEMKNDQDLCTSAILALSTDLNTFKIDFAEVTSLNE